MVNRLERGTVVVRPRFLEQQLDEPDDRGKRIVQLVRDAGQRRSQARHSLATPEDLIMALALRHVLGDTLVVLDAAAFVVDAADTEAYRDRAAVAPPPPRLHPIDK